MPNALLLDDNLLNSGRVEGQLRAGGYAVTTRRSIPAEGDFQLVLINLGSRSLKGLDLIPAARAAYPNARVWGFCGHLEVDIRRAALEAGIDRLLTNDGAMNGLVDKLGE
jgi:CheY-like chemotaxis protein